MPRRIVYGISLWVFLGAAACTLTALILPHWITFTSPTSHAPIRVSYGLQQRCSSITGECVPFPAPEDCHGDDRAFCSMWRSAGFAMNFALMAELACVVAYITILVGGRAVREGGWKILGALLGLVAAAQVVAVALVGYTFDHDNRFFVGWELDSSWALCMASWIVLVVDALGVVGAALFMPREDDYEPIPEPPS